MSDEQENPGRRPGAAGDRAEPGAAGDRAESDATREFAPFDDDPGHDRARSGDAGTGDDMRPPGLDRTAEVRGATGSASPADGTSVMPVAGGDGRGTQPDAPDGTLIMPGDGGAAGDRGASDGATSVLPTDPLRREAAARAAAGRADAWSGRAEVRPRRSGVGDLTPTDWAAADWAEPRESQRAWWAPIVVGIVVLILLAVLGTGVWLIVQAGKDEEPGAPVVVPSVAPASIPASSPPTSATPTTTPPTTATTTEPVEVAIPALVGLSAAEARRALERVGLTYRVIYRPDDAPAETVIDSDPPEGLQVPADTEVTLVLAAPLRTSPVATRSTSPTAEDEAGGD